MHSKWTNVAYYILLSIPVVYFGMLFAYPLFQYRVYYDNFWNQVSFDVHSLAAGGVLILISLATILMIATQESKQQPRSDVVQNYRTPVAGFLATLRLEFLFNYDLLTGLQNRSQIEKVEILSEGYSGAQTYMFYRQGKNIPAILKVAEVEEIDNEFRKFRNYVDGQLLNGPNLCQNYPWGCYAGLEYNPKWDVPGCDHLTFLRLYKECLHENTEPRVKINTIVQGVIGRLFNELQEEENWWHLGRINVPPPINMYQEHYPFTYKFPKIDSLVRKCLDRGQTNCDLGAFMWAQYQDAVNEILAERTWREKVQDGQSQFYIVRAIIHGDLNSRNVLLEARREDHNHIYTVGLVDFSHTGNGLTIKQTEKFIQDMQDGAIQLDIKQFDRDRGHIANDFCRLEADIKFYLTDLIDERDLSQAWILECLLAEQGLQLLEWEELQSRNEFKNILEAQGLSNEAKWAELTDLSYWTEQKARKFILVWKSIKAIRDAFRQILQHKFPQGHLHPDPYYLALLQASLSMIYWQDDRFHNPDLQKLYLVLASGLLCTKL